MIKLNKHLSIFLGTALLFCGIIFFVVEKFYPLFREQSVYYCESMAHAITVSVPYSMRFFFGFSLLAFVLMAAGKLLFLYIRTKRLRSKLQNAIIPSNALVLLLRKLQLVSKIVVIAGDKPFAFCFGMRKPKIYISTKILTMMNEKELEAILLHEKYHLEHTDTEILLFASIIIFLFPFFPILSDLLHNYRIEREIKADQHATGTLGTKTPLIIVLKKLLVMPSIALTTVPSIGMHETLEPRIMALVKNNETAKKFTGINILVSIISCVILFFAVITPVQSIQINSHQTIISCSLQNGCNDLCKEHSNSILFSPRVIPDVSHPYSSEL